MENSDLSKLNYDGELTLEALATLDAYMKSCCNISTTAKKLHKRYLQVRRYLRQPYVRELFQLSLMKKGITPDKVADTITAGIEANKKVYFEGSEVAQDPDWLARQKFIQLACEIYEVLKYTTKVDVMDNSRHLHIPSLQGEELVNEAKRRHIPLPPEIERRFNGKDLSSV